MTGELTRRSQLPHDYGMGRRVPDDVITEERWLSIQRCLRGTGRAAELAAWRDAAAVGPAQVRSEFAKLGQSCRRIIETYDS